MTASSNSLTRPRIRLRSATAKDEEALYELFANTRDDLVAALATLDDAHREDLLRRQFRACSEQYRRQFDALQWRVIVDGEQIVGQLLSAPVGDELRLVDIALLPEYRNRGIGGAVLRELLDGAARDGRRVSLHVIDDSPAVRLYARLGFEDAGAQGIYRYMEWLPGEDS